MRFFLLVLLLCNLIFGYSVEKFDSKIVILQKEKKVQNTLILNTKEDVKKLHFSYPISEDFEILPILFSVKDKFYKVYLKNNRVFFSIFDVKKDEKLEIKIQYKTLNNQQFLQVQHIYIPKLTGSFDAKIQVEIPKDWEVISRNALFQQKKDMFVWEGRVKNGFSDYFWLSIKEASWDISITNYVYSAGKIDNLNVFIPKYFKDSDIKIKKLTFDIDGKKAQVLQKQNNTSFIFRNARAQDFIIQMNAQIANTLDNQFYKKINPKDFLPKEENIKLKNLAKNILQKYPDKPAYIAMAQWVSNTMKYNEKFVSKHMSSEQILSVKNGVCEHYAQLYNDLMQSLGIPSVFVTGVGFNPKKRDFEYHAWNLVFVDNEWKPIDTTWGLFGGKLPISHIFFYIGYQPLVMYETYDIPIAKTHTEVKQKIRFIP